MKLIFPQITSLHQDANVCALSYSVCRDTLMHWECGFQSAAGNVIEEIRGPTPCCIHSTIFNREKLGNRVYPHGIRAMRDKAFTMNEIWLEGKYLMTVEYMRLKANLYSLRNEFVEVYYNDDTDSIEKIQRVNDEDLNKYLRQIHSYLF